jgi:hypothetical protein
MSPAGSGSVAKAGAGGSGGAAGARAGGTSGAAGAAATGGMIAGSGGMGGSMAGTGMEMPASGMLRFTVLTKTLNGRYSPKNIGAIWIERASGEFVKTLELWAATRVRWLARWRAESGSNKVDAMTSATLRSHVMHTASWNLTDASHNAVAPGDYKVVVEMTDHDGNGDSTEVPFTVGDPLMLTPSDQAHFVNMTLTLE